MNSKYLKSAALVGTVLVALSAWTLAAASQGTRAKSSSGSASVQTGFDTPELASAALIDAAGKFDVDRLSRLLGPGSEDLISSEDPVMDKKMAVEFARLAVIRQSVKLSASKKRATLSVGPDDWPLPIPIVARSGKWYFDTRQGRTEILKRRIGSNELDAITICKGFVEAQKLYASEIHDNSGLNQYAQRIISTPGKQDGLFWLDKEGNPGGPISEAVAKAIQEGYSIENPKPTAFHGYYFKILKGRGPLAPGGEIDFVINGAMIGGFALAASPAEYGVTGIKTFIVSHEGIVYQKDLGPDSLKVFSKLDRYNPDKTWTRTDDSWPDQRMSAQK